MPPIACHVRRLICQLAESGGAFKTRISGHAKTNLGSIRTVRDRRLSRKNEVFETVINVGPCGVPGSFSQLFDSFNLLRSPSFYYRISAGLLQFS